MGSSVLGTVAGPGREVHGKQAWPLLSGEHSLGAWVSCPGLSQSPARGAMTTGPLDTEERAVAPTLKGLQSCAWQEQPRPRPPGWADGAKTALNPLSGPFSCAETLRQKQFMGRLLKSLHQKAQNLQLGLSSSLYIILPP